MKLIASAFVIICLVSCQSNKDTKQPASNVVTGGGFDADVRKMANDIANDIGVGGPVQWLNYFEQSPNFFMAVDGRRVFPNNDSATHFIKEVLAKSIMKVKLQWSNMYIDSVSPTVAVISANYHEDLIDKDNKVIKADGYFTGTAEKTANGWKLRNLHWSSMK